MSRYKLVWLALPLLALAWIVWKSSSREPMRAKPAKPTAAMPAATASSEERRALAPAEVTAPPGSVSREEASADQGAATLRCAGRLVVHVVADETGAPLPGILVATHLPGEGWSEEPTAPAQGNIGALQSDALGTVEFTLPCGEALELEVNPTGRARAGRAHQVAIPALAADERREMRVRLVTGLDLVWYGRIVDGATNAPLAGASVERMEGNPFTGYAGQASANSAPDGLVRLDYASWATSFARIDLDDYATGYVHLDDGHERPELAFPVRLLRAASLEMLVTDPRGVPQRDLRVTVLPAQYGRVQGRNFLLPDEHEAPFEVRTDADGRASLLGLPAELPLTIELLQGTKLLRQEERAPALEPGEHRTLSWTAGGACTLVGHTVEENGAPAAGVKVWLLPASGDLLLRDYQRKDVSAETMSGADGLFTFELAAGAWLVGPAPADRRERDEAPDIAPLAQRVEVVSGQTSAEVMLLCWHDLFLRGTVVDPGGQPVESGFVSAMGEGFVASDNFRGGEFAIGPLPPGEYSLRGTAADKELGSSDAVQARAGTDGIRLVLRRGANLDVSVLDENGAPAVDAMVWVLAEPGSEGGAGMRSSDKGKAEFARLLPGTYSVSALSRTGGFALARRVAVGGDAASRELELRLAPGARLRVEGLPRQGERMNAAVLLDGCPIVIVFPDEPVAALAPGEYEVVLRRYGAQGPEELQRQRVSVTMESEARVVFELGVPK